MVSVIEGFHCTHPIPNKEVVQIGLQSAKQHTVLLHQILTCNFCFPPTPPDKFETQVMHWLLSLKNY